MTLKRNDKILFIDVNHMCELLRRIVRDGHNDGRVIEFCIQCTENWTHAVYIRVGNKTCFETQYFLRCFFYASNNCNFHYRVDNIIHHRVCSIVSDIDSFKPEIN